MIDAMTFGDLVQHATVCLVALAALAVIVRRVLGVFETRPAGRGSAGGPGAAPACSHCASGHAAQKAHARRQGPAAIS